MAKVGKGFVKLPDEFFKAVEAQYADKLEETGKAIASHIEGETLVRMQPNREGRLTAIVYLAEPGGAAKQAKHGVLTQAAAAEGLDVRRYKRK